MERSREPPKCLLAARDFLAKAKADTRPPVRLDTSGSGPTIKLRLGLGVYDVQNPSAIPASLAESSGLLLPEILNAQTKRSREGGDRLTAEKRRKIGVLRALHKKYKSHYQQTK